MTMRKSRSFALATTISLIALVPFVHAEEQIAATEQTAVTEQTAKSVNPSKRVCKRVKTIGSHIKQRVCLKQRDWDEIKRKDDEKVRDWAEARSSGPTSGASSNQ